MTYDAQGAVAEIAFNFGQGVEVAGDEALNLFNASGGLNEHG